MSHATRCPQLTCMAGSGGQLLIRSPVDWWRNLVSPLSRPKITIYSMQEVAREKRKRSGLSRAISKFDSRKFTERKILRLLLYKTRACWRTRLVVVCVSLDSFYAQ